MYYTTCTTKWLYKDLWWSNVIVKRLLSRLQHILMPGKGTILSFKQVLMGGLFFSVSSVSFQTLFIPPQPNLLIIILFQEDNIFGTIASVTYGPQIQRHTCIWEQWKLFTVCTEQVRSLYIEHAASGLPNPTRLEGEVRFVQAQDQQV